MLSRLSSSLLVCLSIGLDCSLAAVYYDDNGNILSGESLLAECHQTQVTNTHLTKNVYASNSPVLDHEWTPLLFPEMYDQFDSQSNCGSGSKFMTMDTCFQIHSPMTPMHEEGDLTVEYVQEQYSAKWKNIRRSKTAIYDSFLDNSVAFFVNDLAKYQKLWGEVGADVVYLKWTISNLDESENSELAGATYYSMITHNGDKTTGSTLTQYELISDTFSNLEAISSNIKILASEQRAFFDENSDYRSFSSGATLYPLGARRSVSNLEENVEWYKNIFGASIVDESKQIIMDEATDYNGNVVKYAHIKLYPSEESTTVSFFQRSDDSTYGDLSVLDFEEAMTNTHNENMISPFCGIDRWFDMHYAVTFDDTTTSEEIFHAMMISGEKYTVYSGGGVFVYMTEPNGQSVQMIFSEDSQISFLTTPATWKANWCPIDCSDEMLTYTYGDAIATFTWADDSTEGSSSSSSDSSDSSEENSSAKNQMANVVAENENTFLRKSGLNLFVIGILVFVASSLLIAYEFYPKCSKRKEYTSLPQ